MNKDAAMSDETWEPGKPCPKCGGPTMAANPAHESEIPGSDYCEACGILWDADGRPLP